MSWQKAAASWGATALSAIKRYVGGGACYHQFPRISVVKLFGKSGLGLKSRPHRLPREGKKSYLALLGPQYLPLQRPPANYQTVSRGSFVNTNLRGWVDENPSRRPRQPAHHEPSHRPVD